MKRDDGPQSADVLVQHVALEGCGDVALHGGEAGKQSAAASALLASAVEALAWLVSSV